MIPSTCVNFLQLAEFRDGKMRKLVPKCGLNVCLSHHSSQCEQVFQVFLGEEPFLLRILQYLVGQSCLKDLSCGK